MEINILNVRANVDNNTLREITFQVVLIEDYRDLAEPAYYSALSEETLDLGAEWVYRDGDVTTITKSKIVEIIQANYDLDEVLTRLQAEIDSYKADSEEISFVPTS